MLPPLAYFILQIPIDLIKRFPSSIFHPENQSENRYPASIYLLKVNNRNTRTRCEICSKLTIKTPEQSRWRHFDVFIVNFEHVSHFVLVFLLLTLSM